MTPQHWQEIDKLFHQALAHEPSQRQGFLASACAGDESLRLEVESLISSHEEAEDFIERPAGDVAAEMLGAHQSTFAPGQEIENYRIVRRLGSGGMGEVYLADDTRLNRKVALKLLPPHFTVNPDRIRRFAREAQAASALNHPNIVTIFEIGQSASAHFIATEFIDGKTLRQLMREKPLTLSETLNVAIQVADALVGAHSAGIIHRDIKPENIMVRADGYVKILDFGLAKLTDLTIPEMNPENPTLLQSNPGLVMGTVQYMSPEQSRGKKVGVRADIWSLGIVLYELLAGRVPFSGETPSHVMVSLMEDELPSLTGYENVPLELDRIVNKALRKHQKERYQTALEVARDLKTFKQELQLEARLQGLLEAVPSRNERGAAVRVSSPARGAATATAALPYPTSSAEFVVGEIKRHQRAILFAAAALATIAVAFSYFYFVAPKRAAGLSDAHEAYLRGRFMLEKRTAAASAKSIEYLEQATKLDPNYALAYATLSYAYWYAPFLDPDAPRTEFLHKAKAAAMKALELDESQAEAHTALGLVLKSEGDSTGAEVAFKRGIDLNPISGFVHTNYSYYLRSTGRVDEAIAESKQAVKLEPTSVLCNRDLAMNFYFARRYDEAIAQGLKTLELDSNMQTAHRYLAKAYEQKKLYDQSVEAYLKTQEFGQFGPEVETELRQVYATSGWKGFWRKGLELKLEREKTHNLSAESTAENCARLGELDQAFVWLDKTEAQVRSYYGPDPFWDDFQSDPRYQDFLRRLGLKP